MTPKNFFVAIKNFSKRNKKIGKGFFFCLMLFLLGFGFLKFKEVIEGYLSWQYLAPRYQQLSAKILPDYSRFKPFRNWKIKDLRLDALSAISLAVDSSGEEYLLFSKNPDQPLPIASLSKILSALVVVENYDLNKVVKISKKAIEAEEEIGFFKIGEKFFVKDLLHSSLMESSNDATIALAEVIGLEKFVQLMNKYAKKIEMKHSKFADPIGRDPDFSYQPYNYSTARDLSKLAKFIIQKSKTNPRADFLIQITQKREFYLYTIDNAFHHKIKNTNKLLEKYQNEIILGKTGYTPKAKECFLLVIKSPKDNQGFIINIILGSENRLQEMEKLINWIKKAYIW